MHIPTQPPGNSEQLAVLENRVDRLEAVLHRLLERLESRLGADLLGAGLVVERQLDADTDEGLLGMLAAITALLQEGQDQAAVDLYQGLTGVNEEQAQRAIHGWTSLPPEERLREVRSLYKRHRPGAQLHLGG